MPNTSSYIVLQRSYPAPARPAGATVAPERITAPASLEEASLTLAERTALQRDPRTLAIAMPMPVKLIAPTSTAAAAVPRAASTWGVRAVRAPNSQFSGKGIVVAVLDTGIDRTHPAFTHVKLVEKNFTSDPPNDLNGHGTHCAGTIFGQNVNNVRIGVAPSVDRALIGKVLGASGGSSLAIAQAIQWAVNAGAHVISMSIGIDFPGYVRDLMQQGGLPVGPATSRALEEYRANVNLFSALVNVVHAQGAFQQGAVIVSASGNESNRPNYEIAVSPPAAGTGIIAVGALQRVQNGLSVAAFSNTNVDVSAPGVDVVSALLGGGLTTMNGTSMATPHAAGVAALWAEKQLAATGSIDGRVLESELVASATTSGLVAGAQHEDVGAGLVQAP